MATAEPEPGSDLPAPYRSPWSGLLEALRAVSADLRLALRRLWRRNQQGDLPRPAFWPAGLAALFWPLLLTLLLALAAVLPLQLLRAGPRSLPGTAAVVSSAAPPAADEARQQVGRNPLNRLPSQLPSEQSSGSPAVRQPGEVVAAAEASAGSPSLSPAPPLQLDPLLELLSDAQDARLLQAARPEPSRSLLILTLSPAAADLPLPELQQQAERWQQRAREAGYERLELRDPDDRLRGRQALVGSGMILLAPAPSA